MDGLSVEQNLNKAKSLVRKGKSLEALNLYNAIIKKFPHNKRAQLGIEQLKPVKTQKTNPSQQDIDNLLESYQTGQYAEAENLAQLMTQDFPGHPFGWKVLGAVLKETGRLAESVIPFQKSLEITPQDPTAHSNLGVTLQQLGKLEEAETFLRQAIALKFDYAIAHNNLGITLNALGRLKEAEASLKQAINLKSDYVEAYANLGNTLKKLKKLDEAKESYTKLIQLRPDYIEGYKNLGVILREMGKLSESEESFRQVIALKSDDVETYNNLGNTLQEMGKFEEAIVSYEKAISLDTRYFDAYNNLGVVLHQLGKLEEAQKSFRQAILIKPDFAKAYNNLGRLFQDFGRFEEAKAIYNKVINIKPKEASAYRHITLISKINVQDQLYYKMKNIYNDKSVSENELCHINFGLGKIYADADKYEHSFKHYKEGNLLRKKLLNYDLQKDVRLFSQIKSSYSRIEQNSLNIHSKTNKIIPIFILGMPRSGTTLVEQIISSHSNVMGAGEIRLVTMFGFNLINNLCNNNKNLLVEFRNKYLNYLQNVSNGEMFVTDKMPHNFLYIGLISKIFPEAKIIHVQRNPAATCWGNYKQFFDSKNIGYCYDIDDLVNYYKLYKNLMDFWTMSLDKRIYNINYDHLTIKQEDETKKLLDYIGLNWEDSCMSPEKNTKSTATASNFQIRKKIYKSSSQKWMSYKPFLNGALDYLEKLN